MASDIFALFGCADGWKYLAVIVPMGLFNVIGSLQKLESAEAAGDQYETRPSLLANGIGSLVAALFGSAYPTTIYIGHPGWKAMGGSRWLFRAERRRGDRAVPGRGCDTGAKRCTP